MASLTVNSDGNLTLNEQNGGISEITLGKDKTLTIDFAATINASGTTTVNSNAYVGTTDLIIDAKSGTSTLQQGTIMLTSGKSAKATNDETSLTVNSGSISATASGGQFTNLTDLDVGESFAFNDKTYRQSEVGLINDSTISEELKGTTLDPRRLATAKWSNFVAPSGGVLNLTNAAANAIVLDNATTPTTKLADLSVSNDRINLVGTTEAAAIEAVTIAKDAVLSVDFATQVYAPEGSVKVNSVSYNNASEVVIDSDGEISTLYDGTVILDSTNPTVMVTNDSSTLSVNDGSINVTAFNGEFATIGDLAPEESFTFNDITYTQSAVGLMSEGLISEKLAGETVDISELKSATDWKGIIAPDNGTLDVTAVKADAIVCDNTTNPLEKIATLTVEFVATNTEDETEIPENNFRSNRYKF